MIKRVFLIVLDSFGIGYMPDADKFGDWGANTLASVYKSQKFYADNMAELGLFNIDGVSVGKKTNSPRAAHGRFAELSQGKDTTVGHWEIAGAVSPKPLPTYPDGFPKDILNEFSRRCGRGVLCNKPYSGTQVIEDYGCEHMATGKLIVYTSADSVFQIAAHEDVVPVDELYRYCKIAREILTGEHGVGRVIARPFAGENGKFTRTANRHDFSVEPPKTTMLDELKSSGLDVISVGKINDVFAGRGVTRHIATSSNADGMEKTLMLADEEFNGLCFLNLVDFDSVYGHRNNVDGYANAIAEFDSWLESFLPRLGADDVLIITADHGCDPGYTQTTDHTREYVPMLMYGERVKPINLGTRYGFGDIGKTVCEMLGVDAEIEGESFLHECCLCNKNSLEEE